MLTKLWKCFLAISLILLTAHTLIAQPFGGGNNKPNMGIMAFPGYIPDLTTQQREQIQDLRTDLLADATGLHNEIVKKEAELRKLEAASNPDQDAIANKTDELETLRADMDKIREKHRQDIRALLTAQQREVFDDHQQKRDKDKDNDKGKGKDKDNDKGKGKGKSNDKGKGKGRG